MLINNLSKIQGCLFLCMKNMSFLLVWEIKKEKKEDLGKWKGKEKMIKGKRKGAREKGQAGKGEEIICILTKKNKI